MKKFQRRARKNSSLVLSFHQGFPLDLRALSKLQCKMEKKEASISVILRRVNFHLGLFVLAGMFVINYRIVCVNICVA